MQIYKSHSPDEALLAFNELYYRYKSRLMSYLMHKCKDEELSNEVFQNTFLKLHETKHLYNEKYNFEQWLFIIARTKLIDTMRAKKRVDKKFEKIMEETTEVFDEIKNRLNEDLKNHFLLHELNESQRELVEMKYIDELSYKEMAQKLNKSEVSLRKSLSRIIQSLK